MIARLSVLCMTVGLGLLGCRPGKTAAQKAPDLPPNPLNELAAGKTAAPTAPDLPPNARVELARMACYGSCPMYSLVIHADGTVVYWGEAHVRVHGRRTKTIPPQAVSALVRDALAAGFSTWNDRYDSEATDMASAETTIATGAITKTIRDYGPDDERLYGSQAQVRRKLAAVEHSIDTMAQSAEWVVCPTEERGLCQEW